MTAQELLSLPSAITSVDRWLFDGALFERWNGAEFHTPAHAGVVANVSVILGNWCRENSDYRAFGYGCPYLLKNDPDTVVTFDASVLHRHGLRKPPSESAFIETPPVLAVEVIDLDEDPDLLMRLVRTSLECGVTTVWVIDPDEPLVIVHRKDTPPLYLNGGMWLSGHGVLPGFRCAVAEIFE